MRACARRLAWAAVFQWGLVATATVWAQPVVPGTGEKAAKVGDDFEDEAWLYRYNNPKSSHEDDKQSRLPGGDSANGRWFEGALRGQPDLIKRVPTPEGGIPESAGALLMRTLQSGTPGSPSGQNKQDDLLLNVRSRMGGYVPVTWNPSVTVRVLLPPWDQWEQRVGNSFGFRTSVQGLKGSSGGRFSRGPSMETYWPGMFIHYNGRDAQGKYSASLLLRAGPIGNDFYGPRITEPGWWTLGMSFTPNGQVHYYASAGVDDLTAKDFISSQFPYGFTCHHLDTFFFDLVNRDDGHSWSTPWIIDDPALHFQRQ